MDKIKELEQRINMLDAEVDRLQGLINLNRDEATYHIKSQIENWAREVSISPIPENKIAKCH